MQIVGTNLFYWYGQALIQNDFQKFQDILNGNITGAGSLLAFTSMMKRIVEETSDDPFQALKLSALSSFDPSFVAATYVSAH